MSILLVLDELRSVFLEVWLISMVNYLLHLLDVLGGLLVELGIHIVRLTHVVFHHGHFIFELN